MAAEALPLANPETPDYDSPSALEAVTLPAAGQPRKLGPEYWQQFAAANMAKREQIRDSLEKFKEHSKAGAERTTLFKTLKGLAKPKEGQAKESVTFTFNDGSVLEGVCAALIPPYRLNAPSLNAVLAHVVISSPKKALETEVEIRDIQSVTLGPDATD